MTCWRLLLAPLLMLTPAARLPARAAPLADSFIAGRDASGEPCTASRSWNDPLAASAFDRVFALACRGPSASRRQGAAYALHAPIAAEALANCGPVTTQPMRDIGDVAVRSCLDKALGRVIAVNFRRGSAYYFGSAVLTALGPLELSLRVLAVHGAVAANRDTVAEISLDDKKLAATPAIAAASTASALDDGLEPVAVLKTGISLNYRGVYIEASRLLNDALSRLPVTTPPLTRAELSLEAGLADSNISQFGSADEHFARAAALMANATDLDRLVLLSAKSATYRGLDRINRRQWTAAIAALSTTRTSLQPLSDPAILSELNRPAMRGASASVSISDDAQLQLLLVEALRSWARSVAYLALGDTAQSRAALDAGLPYIRGLQRSVSPDRVAALRSRVQRQYGRVAASAGQFTDAVEYFDCAIATLQGDRPPSGKACLLDSAAGALTRGVAGDVGGPLIAETQLERASMLSHEPGVADEAVLKAYEAAVDSLLRSGAAGSIIQPSMEPYLDLLTRREAVAASPDLEQQFFRAVQAVGEPAIARQMKQLQNIVMTASGLGAKARDRAEIERLIIRLRYEIAAADPANATLLTDLNGRRKTAETALVAINLALAVDPRFRAVDDRPASVAEVRAALRPQEYYLKVTQLRGRDYAMVIGRERSYIYMLEARALAVERIARRVRASIRDDSGRLPFFDVAAAYALFHLIAGPAEPVLAAARAIVVDPSGPLQNLPAGVLVTSLDSVRRFEATRVDRPNDYSSVAFLGASAEISNALSAPSFLITRRLPASTAVQPFIGFGENAPARLNDIPANARVSFGTGCDIAYADLAQIMNGNRPVSAHELTVAASALGFPGAPQVTREDFTDVAILAHSRSGDYRKFQVLHFATHGIPETQAGQCTRIPPSLVTTLAPPQAGSGAQSDGLLSLPEVAQLDLDANLVVLSACETASGVSGVGGRLTGQDESAETLDGLVRAFITANARAVVATYWQVPASPQTEAMIGHFYAAGRTATIGAALREAQRSVIAQPDVSHPYFWGAYFLVGDSSKTMLSNAPALPVAAALPVTTALPIVAKADLVAPR